MGRSAKPSAEGLLDPGPGGFLCPSQSSLRQQHEEGSLQEAAEAAECGHEPVGAEAGVGADHALEDVSLGGKTGQLAELREHQAASTLHQMRPNHLRDCTRLFSDGLWSGLD